MNCKQAKQELALQIGQDGDGRWDDELRRHLETCAECRHHGQELRVCQRALQRSRSASAAVVTDSVWADVSAHLPAHRAPSFNGWLPATAVAAACAALMVLSVNPETEPPPRPVRTLPVGSPTWPPRQNEPPVWPAPSRHRPDAGWEANRSLWQGQAARTSPNGVASDPLWNWYSRP